MTIHADQTPPPEGKARRVYLLLRDEMSNGSLPSGARLPSEHRLADTFGVSRVTVRRALDALSSDGWIDKRVGAGSVVRAKAEAPAIAANFATLMPQLVEMDRATTATLLSFTYGPAPEPVAAALDLARGARVQRAVRVRTTGGRPFSHLTTYVPDDIARSYDATDLASGPLFRLLERSGVAVDGAHQSVTASLAAADVADALEVAEGSALLWLRRVVRDADGRGVEYLSALYRPDLFRLEMTLARVGDGDGRHWEPVIGEGPA